MVQTSTISTPANCLAGLNLKAGDAIQYHLRQKEGECTSITGPLIETYRPYAGPAILTILRGSDDNRGVTYYVALDSAKGINENTRWKEQTVRGSTFMVPCEGRILSSYVMIKLPTGSSFTQASQEYVFDGGTSKLQNPLNDQALSEILRLVGTLEKVDGYHSPGFEGCGLHDALRRLGNALPICDKQSGGHESDISISEMPKFP